MTEGINELLTFWFGALDDRGLCTPEQHKLWFQSSPTTDQQCESLFGPRVRAAIGAQCKDWQNTDNGLIALTLLLDQMPRNIYRNTPQAFSGDAQALVLAQQAIADNRHQGLPAIHQVFLYLPLEHSEDLAVQEQCVSLFDALVAATGETDIEGFRRYAVAHREVIAQFGRFPHRNAQLGRDSTAQEIKHMATHGGF